MSNAQTAIHQLKGPELRSPHTLLDSAKKSVIPLSSGVTDITQDVKSYEHVLVSHTQPPHAWVKLES